MGDWPCPECGGLYRDRWDLDEHMGRNNHYARKPIWDDVTSASKPSGDPIKKTMLPPTDRQKERIKELKDRPEFAAEHLDWLLDAIQNRKMLNTRGQAGILINEMKKRIVAEMKKRIVAAGGNPHSEIVDE